MQVLSPELPSYLEKASDVAARFERIYARPVVMEVSHVSKRFASRSGEVEALREVSFKVHRREMITVIGPSGCGKSTLIRILAGLNQPSSGQILLDGKPVEGPGA